MRTSRSAIERPFLVTEPGLGAHHSEYDPTTSRAILSETAGLLKALGFSAAHATLIGGIVPGLLVPVLDPGVDPHIGTTDVDLCLSVALMEGTTGYYQKIQDVLRQAGFDPTDQSWRWRGGKNASITLEFFCPQPPVIPLESRSVHLDPPAARGPTSVRNSPPFPSRPATSLTRMRERLS